MRSLCLVLALGALPFIAACDDDDAYFCANGQCTCSPGERCAIPCAAPPCHIECAGDNASCAAECANGSCVCGERSVCDFGCQSPPCHVTCHGFSRCSGSCENGSCSCERGASCEFECGSGPCHVDCDGQNPRCDGECQNGSCSCGPGSECHFACLDHNCKASCGAGSQCTLRCPAGRAGEAGCTFDSCAAGAPRVCPGGEFVTCGTGCPGPDAGRP